jgi:teichuronic acid biosynthesis glycosyltransferase TuaC
MVNSGILSMKALFISSGNSSEGINGIVKNQGFSLESVGINVHYFTIQGKGLLPYFRHIRKLRKHLKDNTYDISHAHYSFSGIVAALAGCRPLFVSLMGSDTKKGLFWKTIILVFSALFWDKTIVKSPSMKKLAGLRNSMILPNGVDMQKIRPLDEVSFEKDNKILLFAAKPERYSKNYPLAVRAVSLLKQENVFLKVVHSVSHDKIIREINRSDVLLVTSRWEGSSNLVKEAMACNCPVVTTNVGDMEWLLGDTEGYYITRSEPEDIAGKLRMALEFVKKKGRTKGRERIMLLGLDSLHIAKKLAEEYQKYTR